MSRRAAGITGAILMMGLAMHLSHALGAEKPSTLTVRAGKFDRRDCIVSVVFPPDAGKGPWRLRDQAGAVIALQVDAQRQARFVLDRLPAEQSRTYQVEEGQAPKSGGVEAMRDGGMLKLLAAGKQVLHYQGQKTALPQGYGPEFQRGGYIHPVFTPTGKAITDDYPPNHKHHHGIWAPWTKTEFEGRKPDFWNMGAKTGTVEFVDLDNTWSGQVYGGFRTRHRFVDLTAKPDPKPALNEVWEVVVYPQAGGERPYFVFDLVCTQECAGASPLILPKYFYGGVGFRGNRQWDGKENTSFLTSEGKDRSNGNETRGRWCHIGGKVDGTMAGVAVLCHPDNFRFPQPMRLHPTEPFFCFAPSQLGDWQIEPGKPYVARYRFIVSDGGPERDQIERLFNDYATPPQVTLK